ncbi:MAG: TetR/AcrR family transcriptional regulator [Pseudomonadota bacterium]|nr:TetR/AcrR family transcriptional regulator [Pseudomonadota bacterium]
MPRTREFDPQTVLADAAQIFWRNGYADTSMEDIVSQTGVSRYGLYGTFGNEKELLIAAIRYYDETMNQLLMASLQDHEASLPVIIDYWRTIAEHAKDETFCAGCLIVNVAVEVAPHDSDVSAEVQQIDRKHQSLFTRAIQNGQMKGEVPTHIDAEGFALMLVSLTRGLALMVRAGTDPDTLWPAINAALATLMQKE